MASKSIRSAPVKSRVGANGTPLYTFTETTYQTDTNGKVIPGSKITNLYYSPAPNNYTLAGTSKDGGASWTYTPDPNNAGGFLLGADARRSLETGALKTDTQKSIADSAKKAGLSAEDTKSLTSTKKNGATPSSPEAGSVGAGSSEAAADRQKELNEELKNTQERKSYGNLIYPLKLNTKQQDYVFFEILKYVARGLSNQATIGVISSADRESGDRTSKGSITLYIPSNISDSNSVGWGEDKMEPLDAELSQIFEAGITQGPSGAANEAGKTAGQIQGNKGEVKNAIKNKLVQDATGVNALARSSGAVVNSNLELLFTGPNLRSFTFTFKLSARSKAEADNVVKIIRAFKQAMSVKKSGGALYLVAPDTFRITYKLKGGGDHPYLNTFKECALTNMNVNYTPDGNYNRFYDGPMTSYEMQLTFQELEPVYDSDYNKVPELAIGY